MNSVKHQICENNGNQAWAQITNQLSAQVRSKVVLGVGRQLWNQVKDQIRTQILIRIRKHS